MSNFNSNSLKKLNKKSSYDDLSSFLNDDELDSDVQEDKLIKEESNENLKPKSISSEDLAAKKARIIEGTNFDNSLRKSKKKKSKNLKKSKK